MFRDLRLTKFGDQNVLVWGVVSV